MRNATTIYKALSDANRLRILMMLKEKSLCVCEMVDILGLANSTVSKHLSILRNADLIMDEKDGRWVNYRLSTLEESNDIEFTMAQLDRQLGSDPQIIEDRESLDTTDRFEICATLPFIVKT